MVQTRLHPTVRQAEDYGPGELDRAYDARGSVPDFDAAIRPYLDDSATVRKQLGGRLDVPYGPSPDERLDIFPAQALRAPIHLFVHGGYWRALTKNESSFPAATLVPAGATFICNSYALAPSVTLDEIVRQNRTALAWVYENAESFGADPQRIYVSGHSAGGQLVGMLLNTDWPKEFGLPADLIKGATAISGLFDLRPLRHSFVNEWLGLDDDSAVRNSPVLHVRNTACPLIVAWAEQDTAGFHDQSRTFLAAWRAAGNHAIEMPLSGHDHFSGVLELARPQSLLARAVIEQMELSPG